MNAAEYRCVLACVLVALEHGEREGVIQYLRDVLADECEADPGAAQAIALDVASWLGGAEHALVPCGAWEGARLGEISAAGDAGRLWLEWAARESARRCFPEWFRLLVQAVADRELTR